MEGNSLFPEGTTVVERPIRTPKAAFEMNIFLQKGAIISTNIIGSNGKHHRIRRVEATEERIITIYLMLKATDVPDYR
jgi:hypothetical protein